MSSKPVLPSTNGLSSLTLHVKIIILKYCDRNFIASNVPSTGASYTDPSKKPLELECITPSKSIAIFISSFF